MRPAGRRLHRDDAVVLLAAQLLAHERRDEAAEVRAAARATDDDVGLHAEALERAVRLEADDRLVQQHLVEDGPEDVAVALVLHGVFDGLADRAAERAGGAGVLGEDLAADVRRVRRRGRHVRAVGAHDLAAEGLLLVGALHHEDLAVEAEERAGHRERGAPLAGARLGRDALEALLLGVVGLGDRRVELVRAGGVVALELVVDVGGRAERLLEEVGAHERRRPVHLVEVGDLLRDREELRVVVELLLHQLLAEDVGQLPGRAGLARGGVQQRRGLVLHVRAEVVPRGRDVVFGQVGLVGDVVHGVFLWCGF